MGMGGGYDLDPVFERTKNELRKLLQRLDADFKDVRFARALPALMPSLIAVEESDECLYALYRVPRVLQKMLSQREIEIAILVRQGLVNKVIAKRLKISTRTVAAHLRSIYSKLSIDSRVNLALSAMGLLPDLA
jgi:DNA-binding NarL/FixJ family response regulator